MRIASCSTRWACSRSRRASRRWAATRWRRSPEIVELGLDTVDPRLEPGGRRRHQDVARRGVDAVAISMSAERHPHRAQAQEERAVGARPDPRGRGASPSPTTSTSRSTPRTPPAPTWSSCSVRPGGQGGGRRPPALLRHARHPRAVRDLQGHQDLIEETGLDVEMHTHNDFGMATANALRGHPGRREVREHHGRRPRRARGQRGARRGRHGAQVHRGLDLGLHTSASASSRVRRRRVGRDHPGWKPVVGTKSSPTSAASTPTASSRTRGTTRPSRPRRSGWTARSSSASTPAPTRSTTSSGSSASS